MVQQKASLLSLTSMCDETNGNKKNQQRFTAVLRIGVRNPNLQYACTKQIILVTTVLHELAKHSNKGRCLIICYWEHILNIIELYRVRLHFSTNRQSWVCIYINFLGLTSHSSSWQSLRMLHWKQMGIRTGKGTACGTSGGAQYIKSSSLLFSTPGMFEIKLRH